MLRERAGLLAGALLVGSVTLLALAGIEWGDPPRSLLTRFMLTHGPLDVDRSMIPPSLPDPGHPLGTDHLGRDFLSRLLHGARVSVFVGVTAEVISLGCGLVVGVAAGYAGGRLDAFLMRATEVLLALPVPLLAMGAMVILQTRNFLVVFVVLGLFGWGGIARLVRGEVLSLREREFAEAARALGARGSRVAVRHLVPHALTPALVLATVGIAGNILTEAWLSFLGIGVQPPTPTWGSMIFEHRMHLATQPRLTLLPGLAIAVTAGGYLMLAGGLREVLDPRLRDKIRIAHT